MAEDDKNPPEPPPPPPPNMSLPDPGGTFKGGHEPECPNVPDRDWNIKIWRE